jgi:hypothetical protein
VNAVVKQDAVDGVNTEGMFGTIDLAGPKTSRCPGSGDGTGHIARPLMTATEET